MAIQLALASFQLQDAVGVKASFDQPFKYDDAVTTLANLISWIQGLGVKLDLITEAQITKIRLTLTIPLPTGIKTAAVANSDDEESGLFSMDASGTAYSFGVDVPAFQQSKFTGNKINLSDTDVAAFTTYLETLTTGIQGTDRYKNGLTAVASGNKTFRKHRKALRRA